MFLPTDLMISLLFGNNYIHRRPTLPTFRTSLSAFRRSAGIIRARSILRPCDKE
jgi:hypothetical protein